MLPPDDAKLGIVGSPKLNRDEFTISIDEFRMLSLIDGEPRSADVVALDDVSLLTLTAANFDPLLSDPYFARAILRSLARRFRDVLDATAEVRA